MAGGTAARFGPDVVEKRLQHAVLPYQADDPPERARLAAESAQAWASVQSTVLAAPYPSQAGLPAALLEGRWAEARRIAAEDAQGPFDLAAGPPIRFALVRLAAGDHLFLVNLHHIVADGWSLGIVFRELEALYRAAREGRPDPLPPLPIQYADYAAWQRRRFAGDALEREVEWWRARLQGAPDDLPEHD